jgi:pimeloyl-ACP methyl ester carboxylesterase
MVHPLILLHGALGSADQFAPIVPALAAHFDVHTFNFNGHGGLPIDSAFSIAGFAEQLHAYIANHHLHRPYVFGYSMGGYVALHCAAHHPNHIGRIMTLGTKMQWSPAIAANEIKMLNPDIIEQKIPAFADTLQKRHSPADWKHQMSATASMMTELGNGLALTAEQLQSIHIAVTLCLGEKDQMVAAEETQWAAAQMPNAYFKLIPEWKHPIESIPADALANLLATHFAHNKK